MITSFLVRIHHIPDRRKKNEWKFLIRIRFISFFSVYDLWRSSKLWVVAPITYIWKPTKEADDCNDWRTDWMSSCPNPLSPGAIKASLVCPSPHSQADHDAAGLFSALPTPGPLSPRSLRPEHSHSPPAELRGRQLARGGNSGLQPSCSLQQIRRQERPAPDP